MFKIGYMVFLVKMGAITPPSITTTLCNYATISALRASNADILLFTAASAMIS
jgi:hypothetical protein